MNEGSTFTSYRRILKEDPLLTLFFLIILYSLSINVLRLIRIPRPYPPSPPSFPHTCSLINVNNQFIVCILQNKFIIIIYVIEEGGRRQLARIDAIMISNPPPSSCKEGDSPSMRSPRIVVKTGSSDSMTLVSAAGTDA